MTMAISKVSAEDLTPAHIELVKMLAAIAVEDYLREVEAGAVSTDELTQQNEEIIR